MVTGISWKKDMIPMTNGPGRTRSHLPPSERGDAAERQGEYSVRPNSRTSPAPCSVRNTPPPGFAGSPLSEGARSFTEARP